MGFYKFIMIDKNGYLLNVGIVLTNQKGQLFWGRHAKSYGWQFPQGGVNPYETLSETMYRELDEEVGLKKADVEILAITKHWVKYDLPIHMRRISQFPLCIGQKQKWFLLKLNGSDSKIHLDSNRKPEFNAWKWVDYWIPLGQVIYFKRDIYQKVLIEFNKVIKLKRKYVNKQCNSG